MKVPRSKDDPGKVSKLINLQVDYSVEQIQIPCIWLHFIFHFRELFDIYLLLYFRGHTGQ